MKIKEKTSLESIAFETWEAAIQDSLSKKERNGFKSFFEPEYCTNFTIDGVCDVWIKSKRIGKIFTFQAFEITPKKDVVLDVSAKKAVVGFSFYMKGRARGIIPSQDIQLPIVSGNVVICVSNYGKSMIELYKGEPFLNANLFVRSDDLLEFLGKSVQDLPADFKESLLDDSVYYGNGGVAPPRLKECMEYMCNAAEDDPVAAFRRERYALEIMEEILQEFVIDGKSFVPEVRDHEYLKRAQHFVEERLGERITNAELAMAMGVSDYKLKQLFPRFLGKTAQQFILGHKMVKAKQLLSEKSFSVKETAYAIGYGNPNAFSNAFHKYHGIWPTEYIQRTHQLFE